MRRNPGLADDARYCDWFVRYMRLAANPWMSKRLAELNCDLDVRSVLGQIRPPMLVICRERTYGCRRATAATWHTRSPDSQFVELPGVDHDPWVGDSEKVFTAVEVFVAGLGRPYDVAAGS